jgi:hypothetical protein
MVDWYAQVRTRTVKEWVVPAAEPWGADQNQMLQALNAARDGWHADHPGRRYTPYEGDKVTNAVGVGVISLHCMDDKIVISYEVEGKPE